LHLVDGTFELFRAHYSKRPDHVAPDGRPLKATAGVVSSLLWLLEDPSEAPLTHVAVAFDNPIVSFRNELFAAYKSDEGMEPELRAQFDIVEEATAALGIVVWSMREWEADDAMGTAAVRWADHVDQVRVLSPDKDLGQVVRGDRVVLVDRIRKKVVDEPALRQARGVGPSQIADWLALVGDSADGYPGIPGFGEKTAAALIAACGSLDGIPDDAARWPAGVRGAERLAATLAERRTELALYRELATLVTAVPLRETLEDLRWGGVPMDRFVPFCEATGLVAMIERAERVNAARC
jgi:5'-3' exonuclease